MREFVSLADYTTFKIGGPARYFCNIHSLDDVRHVVRFAQERNLPIFILGGGSNVLVSDQGFSGIVLRMRIKGVEWSDEGDTVFATVDAGVAWDDFVNEAVLRGLWGVENLSGIPGTIGASAVQNIGAYGMEAMSVIAWADVYDTAKDETRRLTKNECLFGYRDSIFKHEEGKNLIVTCVCFRLSKHAMPLLEYQDIKEYMARFGKQEPSLSDIRCAILEIRSKKFPDLAMYGTAGSFFKNPIVSPDAADRLLKNFPDLPHHPLSDGSVKLSAAWIIDHILHLRDVRDGNVGTWKTQPLVLVNYARATQEEIKKFSERVQEECFTHTKVRLEPEVIFVGE